MQSFEQERKNRKYMTIPFIIVLLAAILFTVLPGGARDIGAGRYSASANSLTAAERETVQMQIRASLTITEQVKLTADDAEINDHFGDSVAVWEDTAVIGAYEDDDDGSSSGAAYVFTRTGGVWSQQAKLTANDASAGDSFGDSAAVWEDTAVIGATGDDDGGSSSGSVYVFTRTAGIWSQQAKLTANDASAGDYFGDSVAISGDTVIVGAYGSNSSTGAAYVFTRTAGVWSQQAKLTASDGVSYHFFGSSVAVLGDTAVIGTPGDDDNGSWSGSAYVFTRAAGVWGQQTKLTADDTDVGDQFGTSVALAGETAVIGAKGDNHAGNYTGSAYVFTQTMGTWGQQAKLIASDAAEGDNFGYSVSVSGDTAVIGATEDDDGGNESGSAYVFTRIAGMWSQQDKLIASDAAAGDFLGRSVSIMEGTTVVGAFGDDSYTGSAYVFEVPNPLPHSVFLPVVVRSP